MKTLWAHQQKAVEALRKAPYYGLFDEVGSGKTYPLIFWMLENLLHTPGMWIVVAEVHLLPQWEEEILACSEGQEISVKILTGQTKKHHRVLTEHHPPDILLINYEFFPRCEDWLFNLAIAGKIRGIILDEAHRIKGFRGFRAKGGKRAKSIIKIAHARLGMKRDILRYEATGSPIVNPNSPDIWALYYFFNPEIMGSILWRFEQEFFLNLTPGQPFKKLVLRNDMKNELSRRIFLCARRLLKSELGIEFPEATTIPYRVEMPSKLNKFYRAMQEDALAQHEGQIITRPQLLGRLMALQQVSSGFIIEEQAMKTVGLTLTWEDFDARDGRPARKIIRIDSSHKDKVLLSIMEEIGWDTSVVIWAHFRHELAHIATMLQKRGVKVASVWGDIPGATKLAHIQGFKDGTLTAMVAQPASAGAGLNLQKAGHSIRYSRSYRLLDFEQSIGRIHRPLAAGAHNRVTYHEIITNDSSDALIHRSIMDKRSLSSELTLDDFKEMRS